MKTLIRAFAPSRELAERYLPSAQSVIKHRLLSAAVSGVRIYGAVRYSYVPVNDRIEIRQVDDPNEIFNFFEALLRELPRPSSLFQKCSRGYWVSSRFHRSFLNDFSCLLKSLSIQPSALHL